MKKPVRPNWTVPDFVWNTDPMPKMGTPVIVDLLMEHHVGNARVVIQAGAHLGIWPAKLADYFEKVVAFEPLLENWHAAVCGIQAANVLVIPAALSDGAGLSSMQEPIKRYSGSVRLSEAKGGYRVPFVCIDAVAPLFGPIDAIVLDIEGHEGAVLRGAQDTLKEFLPSVVIEQHDQIGDSQEAISILAGLGYQAVATYGPDVVYVAR